jgi:hypothetical protein
MARSQIEAFTCSSSLIFPDQCDLSEFVCMGDFRMMHSAVRDCLVLALDLTSGFPDALATADNQMQNTPY